MLNSCTSALELAYHLIGIKSGDEVTLLDADEIELTEVILFALLDFEILSPLSLRESIIAKLSKVRQVHS